MHRRQLLKMMSLAGAGALAAGTSYRHFTKDVPSFFLITATPDVDRARLMRLAGLSGLAAMTVTTTPIQAAAQDLSILHQGQLLDPTRTHKVSAVVADFARTLRTRSAPGHTLLTLEPAAPHQDDIATITVNGVVYDRLNLRKNYQAIDVPGVVGASTLRLQDGRLQVTASSCRHGLCKKMGAHATGKLICAPNKLVVTLPGAPGMIDALTG